MASRAIKKQELQSEAEKFARALELADSEVPASYSAQGPLANLQEQFNQLQQQVQFHVFCSSDGPLVRQRAIKIGRQPSYPESCLVCPVTCTIINPNCGK